MMCDGDGGSQLGIAVAADIGIFCHGHVGESSFVDAQLASDVFDVENGGCWSIREHIKYSNQ